MTTVPHAGPAAGPCFDRQPDPRAVCPACAGQGMDIFYSLTHVPVHSCLLMPTRQEAIDYPRGDLRLGYCRSCGFISNTAFDPRVHEYSQRYEETQGFSPTFTAFSRALARRYADRYGLADKTALEIGCGKGEFLIHLCEASGGRGIGIDPGYIPSRTSSPAAPRVRFITDFYDRRHAELPAGFVCCRHTLEHIGPVGEFVRELRRTIGARPTPVFFELPDVMRELREGAFWDLYYEHCSYFSCGSLARLFRASGFDVSHLTLEFNGQYILLDALPADAPTRPRLAAEDDLDQLPAAVETFARLGAAAVEKWSSMIRAPVAKGSTVVWGSGSKGVSFLTTLGIVDEVQHVVDINPFRQGKFMPGTGQAIVEPAFLRYCRPGRVIVMNPIYVSEITAQLHELGLDAEVLSVEHDSHRPRLLAGDGRAGPPAARPPGREAGRGGGFLGVWRLA
jgi:hypothetical protein